MSSESIIVMVVSLAFFGLGTVVVIAIQILFDSGKLKKKPATDSTKDIYEQLDKIGVEEDEVL